MKNENDIFWMEKALQQAKLAAEEGEVPVGAVLVREEMLLAEAGNGPIAASDPTAHAEIKVLRQAAARQGNYRLPGSTLYVTLEPCPMCAGAILHARVARVVFGATDPKTGALYSLYRMGRDGHCNHTLDVTMGILAEQCGDLLRGFFQAKRKKSE
ncbi:MAG: tRNA adenosine(34) deaminase TadA [Desulfopila sp.]|jgi:tRNA(adenine34) deaminase|nr:tRNA adenosine(34) deaminase TadA [Desulfopila sp.]